VGVCVRVTLLAGLGAALLGTGSGCVMGGYDRALGPSPSVAGAGGPPKAGAAGSDARAGMGGAQAGGSAVGSPDAGGQPGPVVDVCDKVAAGQPCNDGLACTQNDRCVDRHCQGAPKICPPPLLGMMLNNDCRTRACVEPNGECGDVPVPDLTECGITEVKNQCVAGLCTIAEVCEDALCQTECEDPSCLVKCADALLCRPSCVGGSLGPSACYFDCQDSNHCVASCDTGNWCTVDCRGATECDAVCRSGATCVYDCRDAEECNDIECEPGAQCSLRCDPGATSCEFLGCDGGLLSCGPDRIGCGGCPE
jgi:hypothetical protein